jgi:hypothetical protein
MGKLLNKLIDLIVNSIKNIDDAMNKIDEKKHPIKKELLRGMRDDFIGELEELVTPKDKTT